MAVKRTGTARGILPAHIIRRYVDEGFIRTDLPMDADQIQPASLDLRLGHVAWRVRASFLPGPRNTVADRLEALALHRFSLEEGAVLETGCVYIVPLIEHVRLPAGIAAAANPKSSTGRLDIFTRVIADYAAGIRQASGGLLGAALRRDFAAHLSDPGAHRIAPRPDPLPLAARWPATINSSGTCTSARRW